MENTIFPLGFSNGKAFRNERDVNYMVRSSWVICLEDITSALSIGNNLSPERGNVGLSFKMFFSHAFKVLRDLLTKTVMQVSQRHVSDNFALAVSQSGYVSRRIVPFLKNYGE